MVKAQWIFFAALLAGCGGAGSGTFIEGNSGSVALTFVAGAGYNGVVDPLNSYTSFDGSAAGNLVSMTATNATRSVEVVAISPSLASGTVIDMAGSTGSAITYIDPVGHWTATSGTITIQSRTTNSAQILFNNVVLTNSGSGSAGTVTISGTMTFVGGSS